MAERTNIEWADASWNPWHGCIKVSPGCRFCYMYREKKMYGQDPTVVKRSKTTFKDPLVWLRKGKRALEALSNARNHLVEQPFSSANLDARNILLDVMFKVAEDPQPKFIFTCSWSDFFITEADKWRAEAWEIIRRTPEFTYLILTKRPDRIAHCLPPDWCPADGSGKAGYPNVWLGTSVENPRYLRRLRELLRVPAARHFLSAEPLLERLNLTECDLDDLPYGGDILSSALSTEDHLRRAKLDWVIVGGESGNVARPMEKRWALDLRDQCEAAGIDFFFKQWGEWAPADAIADSVNLALKTYDSKRELYKVGAEAAGNLLDGKHHLARPEPVTAESLQRAEVIA